MMRQYELSARADSDLADIWLYIARDSPENADRFMDRLYEAFQKLADMPGMGHQRDDLAEQSLRIWPVGQFLIIYRPEANLLRIVRVVNGYRDVAGLLME